MVALAATAFLILGSAYPCLIAHRKSKRRHAMPSSFWESSQPRRGERHVSIAPTNGRGDGIARVCCAHARSLSILCDGFGQALPAPPDQLGADQLQAYLLHLITEKKLAYASVNQAACAFRFLFDRVLNRPNARFDIPMAKVPKRLPQILSRAEVARLIDAPRTLRGRTLLTTTYAAGLRVSEVCALQVSDIESATDRTCLKYHRTETADVRHTGPAVLYRVSGRVACGQPAHGGLLPRCIDAEPMSFSKGPLACI